MLYFVVSLPRTGTASVRRMADICGFKTTHAPVWELPRFIRSGWNFFAPIKVIGTTENRTSSVRLAMYPNAG